MSTFYLLTTHINDKLSQYENHNIPKKHIKWTFIPIQLSKAGLFRKCSNDKNTVWWP